MNSDEWNKWIDEVYTPEVARKIQEFLDEEPFFYKFTRTTGRSERAIQEQKATQGIQGNGGARRTP